MLRLSAIGLALLTLDAGAAGLGEISLQSRVGEPLRAEVAIVGDDAANLDLACFRLAPLGDSDLPVITAARTRLVKVGAGYRLILSGSRPIYDPAFVIALRAGCGAELQRDYVLMPQAPVGLPEASAGDRPNLAAAPARPQPGRSWRADEGDSLESIAETLSPDNPAKQRRLVAGLKRANPELESDMPLAAGTRVRMPEARRKPAPEALPRSNGAAAPVRPLPAPQPAAKAPAAAPGGDRLVLGAAPEELKPGEKPSALRTTMPEVEARILKMETTLGMLNEQVDKLNQALTLAAETLVVQQKLQMAQTLQTPTLPAPAAQPAPLPPAPQSNHWLELLLSALVGGGVASVFAHSLAKRRQRTRHEELAPAAPVAPAAAAPAPGPASALSVFEAPPAPPLAARPPAAPLPASAAPGRSAMTPVFQATTPVDEGIDVVLDDSHGTGTVVDVTGEMAPQSEGVIVDESESALQLAEIMLSFGRVQGAADTLAAYIEERVPDRIEPWLMLLNLYRRGGMRPEFESLMHKIRERFNFRVPDWDSSQTPISGLKSLEDYAHIAQRLAKSWGTQSCMDYLLSLVQDNRQGQRAGFPLEVVEEIAMLMRLLEDSYGCQRPDHDVFPKAA